MIVPTNSLIHNSHNYSTSEQIVGTWIDGKPIYEKTLQYVKTGDEEAYALIGADVDKVISIDGTAQMTDGDFVSFDELNGFQGNIRNYIYTCVENDFGEGENEWAVYTVCGSNVALPLTFIVIVRYTKATE